MNPTRTTGPRWLRALIYALSLLLFFFYTWLLLFVLRDIDRIPGPDYQKLVAESVPPALLDRQRAINKELEQIQRQVNDKEEAQKLLERSTAGSQATLNQLINLHRASMERGIEMGEKEQAAFADSQTLFLDNQKKSQQVNAEISALTRHRQELNSEANDLSAQFEQASTPAVEKYDQLSRRHGYKQAALKLAFLIPVLLISAAITLRKAGSIYRPIVFPLLPASLFLTGVVMHHHFPSALFKYAAIVAGIVVVIVLLYYLISLLVAPGGEWLKTRYREAYNQRKCPVCAQPVARPEAKEVRASADGSIQIASPANSPGEPYTCPSCGTRLFESCDQCGHLRHSLLPFCKSCGKQHPVPTPSLTA